VPLTSGLPVSQIAEQRDLRLRITAEGRRARRTFRLFGRVISMTVRRAFQNVLVTSSMDKQGSSGYKPSRLDPLILLFLIELTELATLVHSPGHRGNHLVPRITAQARDRHILFDTFDQRLAMTSVILLKLNFIPLLRVLDGSA